MSENQTKNRVVIVIVVVSALFGLLGGIAGELVAKAYLLDNALAIPFFGEINLSNSNFGGPNIVFRDAKKIVIEQDAKAIETANSGQLVMAGIYKRISTNDVTDTASGSDPADIKNDFNLAEYYNLKKPLGQGVIISSDGWLMSSYIPTEIRNRPEDIIKDEKLLKGYVVITSDRQVHDIDAYVKDPGSGYVFVHAIANNLNVRRLADKSDIHQGQMVVAVNYNGEAKVSAVVDTEYYSDMVRFSDALGPELTLRDELGTEFNGSVILNLSNDILAVVDADGLISPISNFSSAIVSTLKYGEVRRASLGAYYVELKGVLYAGNNNKNTDTEKGVVVFNDDGMPVVKGSPADLAGFQRGDVLLTVDNREINGNYSLDDILKDYIAEDQITIKYQRGGNNYELKAVLSRIE